MEHIFLTPRARADLIAPIQQCYPMADEVIAIELPQNYGLCAISPQLWGILQSAEVFSIRQHAHLVSKGICDSPPCVKKENTYSIYAGMHPANEFEILRADEVG